MEYTENERKEEDETTTWLMEEADCSMTSLDRYLALYTHSTDSD